MPLPTFERLTPEKQARVRSALLSEFSQYPLATAQVARIVQEAGIARGAFYKYYRNLEDAYRDLFGVAMRAIHRNLPKRPTAENSAAYVAGIRDFMTGVTASGYRDLIMMHYRYNESTLGQQPTKVTTSAQGAVEWARTVLYHQTVRDIILEPDSQEQRLAQLAAVLRKEKED